MAAPIEMSAETERRFVELLLSRKLVIPELVTSLAEERSQRIARGERAKTLAHLVVGAGLVHHETALELLQQVRSERANLRASNVAPMLAPTTALGPGSQLGPYRITAELGSGGMGVVYRALDPRLQREVALKTISGLADAATIERFMLEARATARLQHPGIVSVLGAEIYSGTRVLILELVEGRSLAKTIADAGPLPAREAAALVRDVALAVEAAHAAGIIHRDLKPANVLLGADRRPRLTDFGLARDAQGQGHLTATGETLGTPAYMAPEQAFADASKVGPATDVYGLGAVLYETLAGRPPFQGPSAMAILRAVIEETPLRPSVFRRSPVHVDLETICLKALEKEPARRYPTAAALAADLSRFLEGEPIAARPPGAVERASRYVRRHPLYPVLAALVALVLPALGITLVRSSRQAEARRRASDHAVATLTAVREAQRHPFDYDPERFPEEIEEIERPLVEAREAARDYERIAGDSSEGPAARRLLFERVMELGETAVALGDWRRAEAAFAEAATVGVDDARAGEKRDQAKAAGDRDAQLGRRSNLFLRASDLREAQRLEAAARAYDAIVAKDDRSALALKERGIVRARLHDFAGAEADLGAAIRLQPRYTEAFFQRAVVLLSRGDGDAALADLVHAIELNPTAVHPWQLRGEAALDKGDTEEAIRCFSRAIELGPSFPDAYSGRGAARGRAGDFEGALADFGQALSLDPGDPRSIFGRGEIRMVRGEREGAIEDFERYLQIAPDRPEAADARLALERLRGSR